MSVADTLLAMFTDENLERRKKTEH